MEEFLTINQLAKVTGVNINTLRHWANWELIRRTQNADNGYYLYNEQSIEDVIFITSHRNLGLSVKQLKNYLCIEDNETLLKSYQNLKQFTENKISQLQKNIKKINLIYDNLLRVINSDRDIKLKRPAFSVIYARESKLYSQALMPQQFAALYELSDGEVTTYKPGVILKDRGKTRPVLWTENKQTEYFNVIFGRTESNNSVNFTEIKKQIAQMGFSPNLIITQYIASLPTDPETTDFFDIWIEVFPQNPQ